MDLRFQQTGYQNHACSFRKCRDMDTASGMTDLDHGECRRRDSDGGGVLWRRSLAMGHVERVLYAMAYLLVS